MSEHDNDTCPHLVRASLLEAENARLKAEVEQLQKLVGMQKSIDESIDAWIESKRNAAKEGKPSV
jgi:hypothetical protein